MDEVSADRMTRLNTSITRQAVLTGDPRPNANHVYTYVCAHFHLTYAHALNVGYVREAVPCTAPGCGEVASMVEAATCYLDSHAECGAARRIDYELYRPLTEDEVAAWIASVASDALALVYDLGGDVADAEHPLRLAVQDGYATRLLNGHLALRDMEGVPLDDRIYAKDAVPI